MSVTIPKGYVAAGRHVGIRRKRPDLAVVRSTVPSIGAGMFSRNKVKAACILLNQAHLEVAEPQAVVVNSGVANAATGQRGQINALATAAEAGRLLDLSAEEVLVLSTGVIGVQLPMGKLISGLKTVVDELSPEAGTDAAEAIMTTDTCSKEAAAIRDGFAVGGMAKGAGMIHPNLATMLSVITTDYPLRRDEAHAFLKPAVDRTFNAISIDGDCSTNDTVLLFANGASELERTPETDQEFADALGEVCADLARQIVADGEGVTVIAEINASGALDDAQAEAIAERIAISPLVKTALFGHDPNWGRVLMAAGSAHYNGDYAEVDPDLVTLSYNGTVVLERGTPQLDATPDVTGPACTIDLELGLGEGTATYLTSDLTYDYVRINAEYTT